jgi:hypothetical protein
MPGQPPGNVEDNRRKKRTLLEVTRFPVCLKAQKECEEQLFLGLDLDNSALQPDHRGVGSVVSAQFGQDTSDSALHGFFRD